MRVCLCDEQMASGSGRLTALLCGCADGLRAVCSLTRPSAPLTAKRTGVGGAGEKGEVVKGGGRERGDRRKLGKNVEKMDEGKKWRVGCAARERKHKKTFKKGEEERR